MLISYTPAFQEMNQNELFFINAGGAWRDVGNALITIGLAIATVASIGSAIVAPSPPTIGAVIVAGGALIGHVVTTYF